MPATPERGSHVRINSGFLALAEKRALVWIAGRLPAWINSDHLTALGFAGMIATAAAFWISSRWHPALLLVIPALALNWFGDSLDGTVARVRHHERPRYGYYLDHVLDIAGISALIAGLAMSGLMSPIVALVVLAAYLLVSAEVFLATAVRGEFRMSFLNLGPTELRIVLVIGTVAAYVGSRVTPFGFGPFLLFDVGGWIAAVGLIAAFVTSAVRNGSALHREEPLPGRSSRTAAMLLVLIAAIGAPRHLDAASLGSQTLEAWNKHVAVAEERIAKEAAGSPQAGTCGPVHGGVIDIPGGLIHDWSGCVFLPGVKLDRLLDALQHPTAAWPRQPDVLSMRVVERYPNRLKVFIRMTRSKLVTVTYDTEHDVVYRRESPTRASSRSIATRIAEVQDAGTATERRKAPGEDRGFMWRLNSYWRYQQTDAGVLVHLESLTLSRSVPRGFGFLVQPFITTIARESMERTLRSITDPPSTAMLSRSAG